MTRNHTPAVIVHGTRRDRKSVQSFREPLLQAGFPVDLRTYTSLKDGAPLQESGQHLSATINEDRIKIASTHMAELKKFGGNSEKLRAFLDMDDNLYGTPDRTTDAIAALIPGVIDQIDNTLKLDPRELTRSFSLRIKQIEDRLALDVLQTGFGAEHSPEKRSEVCKKVSAEILDSIAPKAVVIGHSMGGFVLFAMTVNPTVDLSDNDAFHYDAGHGIATTICLSSPVKSGVTRPLPPGLANQSFDTFDQLLLSPIENTPGMHLALLNPFFATWYALEKQALKTMAATMVQGIAGSVTNPLVYLQCPGVEQISEGSDFIKNYIQGRPVPEGVTAIALSSKLDGIAEADHSILDDRQSNALNVDAHLEVPPGMTTQFGSTPGLTAHNLMGSRPLDTLDDIRRTMLDSAESIRKVLDRRNYDGMRWQCLNLLLDRQRKDPGYLRAPAMEDAVNAIREVASEKLPFRDSPSYAARQMLDELIATHGTDKAYIISTTRPRA